MKWLDGRVFQYAPDEGGGGTSVEDNADGTFSINGEDYSAEELKDARNNADWKRSNTASAKEVSAEKGALTAERAALAREREAYAMEREENVNSNREARAPAPPADPGVQLDMSNVPNVLDAPEGYTRAMGQKMQEAATGAYNKGIADTQRIADAAKREAVNTATAAVNAKVTKSEGRQAAFRQNEDMLDSYFSGHPEISQGERSRITKHMDNTLRDPAYGLQDSSGVFIFNREAVELANRAIRHDSLIEAARNEGYQSGLTQSGKGFEASKFQARPGVKTPSKGATAQEVYEFGKSLPENSQAASQYFESLSPEQVDQYLEADAGAVMAEVGA